MNSAAVATITPARKSETPKVEETKVKSSAEYLKEFNEFYNDKVEIKIEEKEEEKYEKEKELKEKELKKEEFVEEEFEEETEDEVKEKKEEEEDKDGKLCAAPQVKPYMAPPNPLDLCEDLEDALTAAEDRIGKLEAEKAVFEARLARQDELIAELLQHKAASDKRFEELESALADHNTRAASRSSMRPPPSSPPPSPTPPKYPKPPPPLPPTPPLSPTPRHHHLTPSVCRFHLRGRCTRGVLCTFSHPTATLGDLQVLLRRPPAPCRHHLARRCWFGSAGAGCKFAHSTLYHNAWGAADSTIARRPATPSTPRRARPPPWRATGKSAPRADSTHPPCASLPRVPPRSEADAPNPDQRGHVISQPHSTPDNSIKHLVNIAAKPPKTDQANENQLMI